MVREDPFSESNTEVQSARTHLLIPVARRSVGARFFLASPTDRAAALVIDLLILVPIISILIAPLRQQMGIHQIIEEESREIIWLLLILLSGLLLTGLYQTLSLARWGATPGKMFFNLRVVSIWDGKPLTLRMAAQRSFFWCLEAFLLFLPNLATISNPHRRAMHDRLSDSIVTAPPLRSVGTPQLREVAIVHGAIAALAVSTMIYLGIGIYELYHEDREPRLASESMADAYGLCTAVNTAIEADATDDDPDSRLEIAMSLFASGLIDNECLEHEADFSLRQGKDEESVYLAKSLALSEFSELSEDYYLQACRDDREGLACGMAKVHRLLEEGRWDEVNETFNSQFVTAPTFVHVWALRHHMMMKDFVRALQSLHHLEGKAYLAEFVGGERLRALWYMGRRKEAEIAGLAGLENYSLAVRLEVANWLCSRTLLQGCAAKDNPFCRATSQGVRNHLHSVRTDEVGVTYLSLMACEQSSPEEIEKIGAVIESQSGKQFLAAMREQSLGHIEQAASLYRDILASEKDPASPYIMASLQKWLEIDGQAQELALAYRRWEKMDKTSTLWFEMGDSLLTHLIARKDWSGAYKTARRLILSVPENESIQQSLITAAFLSGRPAEAKQYWDKVASKALPPLSGQRLPAQEPHPYWSIHVRFLKEWVEK